MSAVKLTRVVKDSGHAFTLRREPLATLHNTNAQYLTFVRWRISPAGVFWDFPQASKSFAMFDRVNSKQAAIKVTPKKHSARIPS